MSDVSEVESDDGAVLPASALAAELPYDVPLLPDGRPAPLVYDGMPEQRRFYIREANDAYNCATDCVSAFTIYDADMVAQGSFELDGQFSVLPAVIPNHAYLSPFNGTSSAYLVDLSEGTAEEWPYVDGVATTAGFFPKPTAVSPWIVVTDSDGATFVLDVGTNETRSLPADARVPLISPSGRWLSYLDQDGEVTILDVASGQVLATIAGVQGSDVAQLDDAFWSPGESRLSYSGLVDGVLTVQVADLIAGAMVSVAPAPDLDQPAIAGWHDEERLLARGRLTRGQLLDVQLINVATGELGPVIESAWGEQSFATQQWHVTSSGGGTVVLTDVESGETTSARVPDTTLEPIYSMRTPRYEWRAIDDVSGGSVRIDFESGEITTYELFQPQSRDRSASAQRLDFEMFITSPDREPVPIEATNVSSMCANGDVASSGIDRAESWFPGRVHSFETGEVIHEFDPGFIACFG